MSEALDAGVPHDLGAIVAAADPIPFDVLQSLRSCFEWRASDAEIAELTYDSVMDELVGVRGGSGSRQLTFEGAHVSVEMAVAHDRGRIIGQLVPAVPGQVEVRQRTRSYLVEVDGEGRFTTDDVPKGPVSFRCWGSDGDVAFETVTDWVTL